MTEDRGWQVPSSEQIEAHDEIQKLRGSAISSFTQIEFLLAYFVQRAALKYDVYKPLVETMPFSTEKRIKRVKQLLAIDGPLQSEAEGVNGCIEGFEDLHDLRRTVAHGYIEIVQAPNGFFLQTLVFQPESDPWRCIQYTISLEDYRVTVDKATRWSDAAVLFFFELFARHGIKQPGLYAR